MPAQVRPDTIPDQIEKDADEYAELLKKSSLVVDREKILDSMRRKAASLQTPPMTVPEWEKMWADKTANTTPVAPVKGSAKPTATPKQARGVVRERERDYFYITPENAAHANTWVEINKQGDKQHMLLVGPAGCGKTSLFSEIGKQFEMPVYKVDAAAVTSIDRWLGHKDVRITDKGPETTYVMSEFLRWISADGFEPGIVVIDEITRVPPQVSNILMSILDGSESVWVPELGIRVNVHPDVLFGATANIGVGFSGTYALDQALQDRFGTTLEVTFPPAVEEQLVLAKKIGIDDDSAEKLVKIANFVRAKTDEIDRPISTRMLLHAALWVAKGRTVVDACDATIVKQYSNVGQGESDRTKVKLIIHGVAGK
jgi:MoxR-like ATPase